ncbi:YIP1 family protein [Paenibacillus brevis]|uniref:YIP1 family protein n=1 Tax=Paenibacillus brevis TaxID=2841508 RepID=A0ABS6FVS5_9BACL|nr:YIP1 family protein [Paenibacillus brevis]MBU5673547.1 YIP1 family protein [Paenibacillus brevis]
MSYFSNLFTIFSSPAETFKRVKANKLAWLFPFLLIIIISLISVQLQMPATLQTTLDTLKAQPNFSAADSDLIVQSTKIMGWVMAPLTIAFMVFLGGLVYLLLNLIVRGEAKYMQLVTMITFAMLPSTIGGLITAILVYTTGAASITDISLSLGALVADKESLLYHLLSIINPFSLWGLALYVIGSSVMMNRPRKTVGIWIIGAWLIISIISLGSLLLV